MGVNEIDFRGLSASRGLNDGLQIGAALGGMYRRNRLQDDELERRNKLEAQEAEKQKQKEALELMYRDALYIKSLPSYEAQQEAIKERVASGGVTGNMEHSASMIGMNPERFNRELDYVINRLAPFESLLGGKGYTLGKDQVRYDGNNNIVASNLTEDETGPDIKTISDVNKQVTPMIQSTVDVYRSAASLEKLREVDSPAAKLAAVFKFMKALDPSSVVRETEQGQVYSAGGLASELAGKLNSLKGKGALEGEVFDDLVLTAKEMANRSLSNSREEMDSFLGVYSGLIDDNYISRYKNRIPKPFDIPVTKKPPYSVLPDGTKDNGDGTYTLPDGRTVRQKQ